MRAALQQCHRLAWFTCSFVHSSPCREWQQRLEAVAAKAKASRQMAAASSAAAAAQREREAAVQLAAVQEAAAAKLADQERQWALKLAAAEEGARKVPSLWLCCCPAAALTFVIPA